MRERNGIRNRVIYANRGLVLAARRFAYKVKAGRTRGSVFCRVLRSGCTGANALVVIETWYRRDRNRKWPLLHRR